MSSGPVFVKAEPPLGDVDLMRGDTEVEQDAGDLVDPGFVEQRVEMTEVAVEDFDLARIPSCVRVAIDPDDGVVVESGVDGAGVASPTEGGVDDHTWWNRVERLQDFLEEDWLVISGHCSSNPQSASSVSDCRMASPPGAGTK